MANSTVVIPGDGVTTLVTVNFVLGQISPEDVTCHVTGEVDSTGYPRYRTFTFNSGTSVQVDGAPCPVGQSYVFNRTVTHSKLLVDYEDGDGITAENLNKAQKQAIMLIHQLMDESDRAIKVPLGYIAPTFPLSDGKSLIGWDPQNNLVNRVPEGESAALAEDAANKILQAISSYLPYSILLLFGAKGDGALNPDGTGTGTGTIDNVAFQTALNNTPAGSTLDMLGRTYRITATLTVPPNITLANGWIDASGLPTNGKLFSIVGSAGTPIPLAANAAKWANTVVLDNVVGLAPRDIILIKSGALFYPDTSPGKFGQQARIKSIAGNTITLYDKVRLAYNVADSATVQKVNGVINVTLENIIATGGGVGKNQMFADCNFVSDIWLKDCHASNFEERNINLTMAYHCRVLGGSYRFTPKAGTGYGIAVNRASYDVVIDGVTCEDMRHGVTIGGVDGVNSIIKVVNCTMLAMTDAGIDSHPCSDECTFENNVIEGAQANSSSGIVSQGINCKIIGNTVRGRFSFGIWVQHISFENGSAIVMGNRVEGDGTGTLAYAVDVGGTPDVVLGSILGLVVADNTYSGCADGLRLYALRGDIRRFSVTGLVCQDPAGQSGRFCVLLRSAAAKVLADGVVANCTLVSASTTALVIHSIVGGVNSGVLITGNRIRGGGGTSNGIAGVGVSNYHIVGNQTTDVATPVNVTGTAVTQANNV